MLHAVGCNAQHGLRRTREDKRRAVRMLLEDAEWSLWSDREISRVTNVTHPFVSKLREEMAPVTGNISSEPAARKFTTKHGTEAVMNTAGIGKSAPVTGISSSEAAQDAAAGDDAQAVTGENAIDDGAHLAKTPDAPAEAAAHLSTLTDASPEPTTYQVDGKDFALAVGQNG